MALISGTKLGPYEIISPVGAGGMGEVYRARDIRLDRTVAIKILPTHLSSKSDSTARFEREARAISSLNHPYICHLYDIGSQDGAAYLVMEYLEGETLAQRLRKGAIPLKQALQYGVQITDALATAHRAGILHRDLKPANIMLTPAGAKLMDFGLAKTSPAFAATNAAGAGQTPSSPTLSLSALSSPVKPLTQHGAVVGTFQYMAPELLRGAVADARSDIFSLGCVLYEMVTGRRPFEGKTELSVLTAILEKEPEPASQLQPTSPPALDHVIKICLEKDPEERFQTARDVKLELRWIADNDKQRVAAPTRHRLQLGWIAVGIAALVAIAVAAVSIYIMFKPRPTVVLRASILPPPGTSFLSASVMASPPSLSPDGTRLAFTARDDKGKTLLYVRQLNSLEAHPLPGTDNSRLPFWSPDSREIGFFADDKLKRIDAAGGPPQTICDGAGFGGAWSNTGVIVFASGAYDRLLRVSAAGGASQPASNLDTSRGENSHRWPYFLPDGKHFLFWSRTWQGVDGNALYVGTLDSLQAKLLTKSESMAVYASGYLLFLQGQTLMARPFDLRRLEFSGEAAPLAEHVAVSGATNRAMFSTSDSGALLYQAGEDVGEWSLQWFSRDGKQIGSVAQPDHYLWPRLSPDGKRLAVSIFSGLKGTGDIWIFDLAQGTRTRLTFGPGFQRLPVWSPDGKTIFYASSQMGRTHIYAKASDGSGSDRLVLETKDASEYPTGFSPDGQYLVYVSLPLSREAAGFWALPLAGDSKPFPIVHTATNVYVASGVSPDGRWLAYPSIESGRMELYVTAFPGGGAKWQVSTNGGEAGRWRKDGKELFFLEPLSGNLMAIAVNTSGNAPQFGTPQPLFHVEPNLNGPFDVTADGKRFVVNSWDRKEAGEPATMVLNWPAELKK